MTDTKPRFLTGFDNVTEGGGGGKKIARNFDYFKLDNGKQLLVRFVTEGDEIIGVQSHQSVPTKPKPEGYTKNWPEMLPAVCRHDPAFAGIFSDCYICDFDLKNPRNDKKCYPTKRYWALAVERREVRENGRIAGYEDVYAERPVLDEEGKDTGRTQQMLKVIVLNLGAKNFFSALKNIYGMTGSITEFDFAIVRSGTSINTVYTPVNLPLQMRDDKNRAYGKNSTPEWWEEHYTKPLQDMQVDLGEIIMDQASDSRYGFWFDHRVSNDRKKDQDSSGNDEAQSSIPAQRGVPDDQGDIDPAELATMAARVRQFQASR